MTILIAVGFFVAGLCWGVTLTMWKMVEPMRKRHHAQLDAVSKMLDDLIKSVGGNPVRADESMVSPIQIRNN